MNHYKHLSMEERESLLVYKTQGLKIREIADLMGRSASTISRELSRNRNQNNKEYSALMANAKYKKRRKACRRHQLLEDVELVKKIHFLIAKKTWSPEQVSNRLRLEKNSVEISYATIYRGINSGVFNMAKTDAKSTSFKRYLRRKGKARKKANKEENRGKITISNPIEDRPSAADKRSEKGHWEADTVAGKKSTGCLVTLVERYSRFLLSEKLSANKADLVQESIVRLFRSIPSEYLQSITTDRGKEFSNHAAISASLMAVPFFFSNPHAPWEKPSVENTNGLLRQFMPKRTSFEGFSNDFLQNKVVLMNLRPRKCLNWKTPFEVLFDQLLHLT